MHAQRDDIRHHVFDTALGPCGVAWNGRGVCAVRLPEKTAAQTEKSLLKAGSSGSGEPPPWVASLIADMQRYFGGEQVDFSAVAVDLEQFDPFRRKLYEALRTIGFGATTTYGELARRIGADEVEGARDVGAAMGRNPVPVVIPCHRVLAAGGKLGGFSAPGGAATKQKLLALEGVHFDAGAPRLPGL
jgi:methylated-DNA-[protein]-cysteine S-methyltransferase